MNYAIINNTGLVINAIEWDGISPWQPPAKCTAVATTEAGIGWGYVNGQFTPPPASPVPEATPELTTEQKLEAAGLTVAELKELFGLN
jgi:hypothetical protein